MDWTTSLNAVAVGAYVAVWGLLALFGLHRAWMVWQYVLHRDANPTSGPLPARPPSVLVQLPIYNERFVASRLIRAVAALDYPRERLSIQVLDDSTDDTTTIVAGVVAELQAAGVPVEHLRRGGREGYKAGALAWGLERSDADLVAIFDADFVPRPDFLRATVPHFNASRVGMVQTRWGHLNREHSPLTRAEAVMLDGHFVIEHTARNRARCFFNFNGTAGIWRADAIREAGGWTHDTLTEDLDLSFRAQLAGWRFVYLRDVISPAELPAEIKDFKTQQHRWTRGAIQTARKILPRLWRSAQPARVKLESTCYLLSNLCYPLMVAMGLLLGPVVIAQAGRAWSWSAWLNLPLLVATIGSIALFYLKAEREAGRGWLESFSMLPAVMCLGIGMSLNNAWAVVEGWLYDGGEFVRTPKYALAAGNGDRPARSYTHYRLNLLPWLELLAFAYCLGVAVFAASRGIWTMIPFLLLFVVGFGWVALLTWRGRFAQRRQPALAAAAQGR